MPSCLSRWMVAGSRDKRSKCLDDDHVEVLLSHTFEQTLIAISRVFGKARLCSVDKFTNDIEAIACGDLPAE